MMRVNFDCDSPRLICGDGINDLCVGVIVSVLCFLDGEICVVLD